MGKPHTLKRVVKGLPLKMTRAGFEPALPKETVLETVALDHSANES